MRYEFDAFRQAIEDAWWNVGERHPVSAVEASRAAANAAIAYLSSCETVEAVVDGGFDALWDTVDDNDAARGQLCLVVRQWDALRAQLVATREQLATVLALGLIEQDEHSAERARLVRELDDMRALLSVQDANHSAAIERCEELEDEVKKLRAAGIACTCGGVACPFCGDEEARLR